MPRLLKVAAVQVGAIHRNTPRTAVLDRLIALLDSAAARGVQLAVFPEITFTTFFPRYIISDEAELESYFERESAENGVVDSPNVARFFAHAKQLGIDVAVGYAEKTPESVPYNTACYVSGSSGKVVSKYRKVHLPGTLEPFDEDPLTTNQLEKRYFKPGDLGFKAFRAPSLVPHGSYPINPSVPIIGQLICNDRRWSEGWRVYGLQGVEIICIGYASAITAYAPQLLGGDQSISREKSREEAMFHHKLVVQANAYMNATFCIASARAGWDDGHFELISGTMIVDPEGHVIAESQTTEDELVLAEIDLDACLQGKQRTFCFEKHRRPEHYGMIVSQKGVVKPPEAETSG
ncbi:carbon-nitrogen hydrolase [Phellopilus nigrolimitatus]|nr:carbon-nitrogen hydrolase [Phellopilus nigrolimitatus]